MRQLGQSDYKPLNSRTILMRAEKKRKYIKLFLMTSFGFALTFAAYTFYQFTHKGELTKKWNQSYQAFTKATINMGFVLSNVKIEGRIETEKQEIDKTLALRTGEPLISIAPQDLKAKLEQLPWVYKALVERRFPDTIKIQIIEKLPMALWQQDGKLYLIDHEGKMIKGANTKKFNKLPLLVGDFAPSAAPAFFDFVWSEDTLHKRVTSAVWVGDRRWDVHLKDDIIVKLPEKNPEIAWTQLALIEQEHRLLTRDVAMLDFRLDDRIIVKMKNEDQKNITKQTLSRSPSKMNT